MRGLQRKRTAGAVRSLRSQIGCDNARRYWHSALILSAAAVTPDSEYL